MKNRSDVDHKEPLIPFSMELGTSRRVVPHFVRADDDEDEPGDKEEPKAPKSMAPLEQDLLEARTILVHGAVDDKLAAGLAARVLILEDRDAKAPITVYVNSPGGSADSGFAMYDILRFVRCPVRTIVNGLCASAGVLVFLGGDKGSRLTLPGSRFLLHQPSTAGRGTASDLHITAQQVVKLRERYNRIVAEATGRPDDEILEASKRDFWLSASEAKEYGLADRIVTTRDEL
ncbi:MAG TPA: ATP-dependent Clp protease proteolytic subunit [Planctomycetota bacterium]|nr:ATP-dependent Clp protease proteolytic subunit [Planctomycetota bacterium]